MSNQDYQLTILLPTFNEKENIFPLIKSLEKNLKDRKEKIEILFIDDSDDETPKVIERAEEESFLEINMVHRSKDVRTGLATAFVLGFKKAKGKYICCMDSDLQHPPKIIKKLYEKARTDGADVVVASRYIRGGDASGLGGIYRRLVSIGLKYFVNILFIPTRQTTDPGSGFFLFKADILKEASLDPRGFKILIEILMRANYQKVSEVPYKFLARENDDSKANFKQGAALFSQIWLILKSVPEARTFLKFCLVGFLGVLVNLSLLFYFVAYGSFPTRLAWLAAVSFTLIFNFLLNIFFTYKDKKMAKAQKSIQRVQYYYLSYIPSLAVNYIFFTLSLKIGLHFLLAGFVGILCVVLFNFLITVKFIWRKV